MARSVIVKVLNNTGSTIATGTAVYQTGWDNELNLVTIAPASYESLSTMPAIGVVREDILPNAEGVVKKTGLVGNINTSNVNVNDPVFVGSNGELIFQDPTEINGDYYAQQLGTVTRSGLTDGLIDLFPLEIRPKIKHEELLDVFEEQHQNLATASNVGGGAGVFDERNNQAFTFKSIVGSTKIAVNDLTNRIEITDVNLVDWTGSPLADQVAVWTDGDTVTGYTGLKWDNSGKALAIAEGSGPSLTSGYGKLFVKSSDSRLYFLNDSGTEFDLLAAGTGVSELTFQQNKQYWDEAIHHLTVAADGYSGGAGFVSGSGSSGQVTFWNGTSSVTGEAELYWDTGNNRLGINTGGSPAYSLDVTGEARISSSNSTAFILTSSNTTATQFHLTNSSSSKTFQLQTTGSSFSLGGGKFSIYDGTDHRFIINTTGEVWLDELSSSPGTPSSGYGALYVKTDGLIYFKNDAGTEYDLTDTGGGGGGLSETTFQENKAYWDESIYHLTVAADGYGSSNLTAIEGADGYIAFFTGANSIAGDNDLFFDRINHNFTIKGGEEIGKGSLLIGEAASPVRDIHIEKSINSVVGQWIKNTNSGISAFSQIQINNDAALPANLALDVFSTGYTGAFGSNPIFNTQNSALILASRVDRMMLYTSTGDINMGTNGTHAMTINTLQHVGVGTVYPIEPLTINGVIALQEVEGEAEQADGYGKLWVADDFRLYFKDSQGVVFDLTQSSGSVPELTFQQNKAYWDETVHHLTVAADGYVVNQTFEENKNAQSQLNSYIFQALDGYAAILENVSTGSGTGTVTSTQGADGYVAFFTTPDQIAGDNDLYWDREDNSLGIGTDQPNEKLTVAGAVSLEEITEPITISGFGKLYVNSDNGRIYFKRDNGENIDLTAFDIDGGNFFDTFENTRDFDAGTF